MVTFRAKLMTLAATLFLGACSFAFAFFVLGPPLRMPAPVTMPDAINASGSGPAQGPEIRLLSGARLIKRYVLPDGRQGLPLITSVPESWYGLSATDLAAAFPNLQITEFQSGRVVAEERCDVAQGAGFVGVADGRVTVYEGVPGHCQAVLEQTQLDAATLPPFVRDELERGIRFNGSDERVQILDGLKPGVE